MSSKSMGESVGVFVFDNAVYRFTRQGVDKNQKIPWSLILKTFFPADTVNPSSPYYPQREPEAYRSGWLDDLPGGLTAPACYGVVEYPDGEIWVWPEQVVDDFGGLRPLERYGLAVRHLGQFNGAYLVSQSLPTWPWFSENWLRSVVTQISVGITKVSEAPDHLLVRRYLPGDDSHHFLGFCAERERLLDALDQLQHTICHLDDFSRNIFSRSCTKGDQTIAIDRAFVGKGAVGEELEPLACRSFDFYDVNRSQANELDNIAFTGYLSGLRDAGWQGDPGLVRLGFTAAVTLRFLTGLGQFLTVILDGSVRSLAPQILGIPFDETVIIIWCASASSLV